jgi:hypothetical protein
MQQTVMVFDSAAARTTALTGVVSEGMITYLKDTNAVEVYDGSSWVASDDPNAIQNTIVDAKGDLIAASAADVPARLAVGNDGETLIANSSAATGLSWAGNFPAGRNKIINGDFGISQRGITFTNPSSGSYTLDRFSVVYDGTVTSHTVSQQTFTPGTAPVAGYEGTSFARWAITTNGTSTYRLFTQRVEDVRTFAGQQITFSFWMKADSARTLTNATYGQNFGSGGSGTVESTFTLSTTSLTTSWQRITGTATVPSISGKTIGTGSNFFLYLSLPTAGTFDMWGWQVEAGSTASPFQTATGTKQGELAACQRYYNRYTPGTSAYGLMSSSGYAFSATLMRATFALPVEMRVVPTAVEYSTLRYLDSANATGTISAANLLSSENSPKVAFVEFTSTGMTANRPTFIQTNNSTSGYVGFTAEL